MLMSIVEPHFRTLLIPALLVGVAGCSADPTTVQTAGSDAAIEESQVDAGAAEPPDAGPVVDATAAPTKDAGGPKTYLEDSCKPASVTKLTLCVPNVHIEKGVIAGVPIFLLSPQPRGVYLFNGRFVFTGSPSIGFASSNFKTGPLLADAQGLSFAAHDGSLSFQTLGGINTSGILLTVPVAAKAGAAVGDTASLGFENVSAAGSGGKIDDLDIVVGKITIE
jgi:hypothetical protein